MEIFTNKSLIKKISVVLIVLTLLTTIIPLYSYADEDEEVGGKLFKPIFKLFAGVGDLVMKTLQKIFIGDGNIAIAELPEIEEKTFKIRYSPGVIFSGNVPALDANFIKPGKSLEVVDSSENKWKKVKSYKLNDPELAAKGFSTDMKPRITETDGEWVGYVVQVNGRNVHVIYEWTYEGKKYTLVNTEAGEVEWYDSALSIIDNTIQGTWDQIEKIFGKSWTLYELNENITKTGEKKVSTAEQLQENISKWYNGLRLFALVGLLSVLVYMGIRIIISSTGQEKAKYKKMIMDWIVAVCILFILQYIMSFTMTITEQIVKIFKTNVIGPNGEDVLMTGIRQKIGNANSFSSNFGYLIMYLVLVIYTAVFTVHYLKRLIYLAFFTMIAPLIALTYPLDKVKDGQAQAFSMWLREYVFNALIPVIHIVLYSIFIGSALEFAQENPLYAIVCIAFLIPAEKFVRKMFGFDKATTSGQLGAAAGGAMVMNAINKIGHKPPKQSDDNKSSKVRTSGGYSGGGYSEGIGSDSQQAYGSQQHNEELSGGTQAAQSSTQSGESLPLTTPLSGGGIGTPTQQRKAVAKPSIKNGINSVRKKYINRKTPKKIGRLVRKGLTGAAGAAALGTFGLAAGLATGDLGNVVKYAGGGMAAGAIGASRLSDKAAKVEKENRDTYMKGYLGKEEFETRELLKQVWENDDIYGQYGKNKKQFEADAREFVDGGITNKDEIIAAMKMKKDNKEMTNLDAITIAKLNRKMSDSSFGDPEKVEKYRKSIANSLRSQGYTGDADKEASRQIKLIDQLKINLNNL